MIDLKRISPRMVFDKVINLVFSVMLIIITLGIIIGTARLFYGVVDVFGKPGITGRFRELISDVLTLFILIELSRSLVEYFNIHRIRLTFIVDAGIVFVLREVMINLFEHKISTGEIYALSALLFVLTVLRLGSVLVFYQEQKLNASNAQVDQLNKVP